MPLKARPHARLEDRDVPLGVQATAVDDADAAMPAVAVVNELLDARGGFPAVLPWSSRLPGVFAALQFSELTPIHPGGDELNL